MSGPVNVCFSGAQVMNSGTSVLRIEQEPLRDIDFELEKVSRFFDVEGVEVLPNEQSVGEEFLKKLKFNGDRYEVSLPFKPNHPILEDNYRLSINRLGNLLRKLKKQPELIEQYDNIIKEQKRENIIEEVSNDNEAVEGVTHYLPHKAVIRDDKETTKMRMVFDASAKQH